MASITDGNIGFLNQGKNPLVNFNFMLRVELAFDLPCKSVRAFSRELEYDFVQEGGLNDYVHMLRKPISRPFTLEVERYVGVDYFDVLPLGEELVLPVMLFVGRVPRQFIPFVVARTYVFTGVSVMKKTYGDLIADQSGLLVETTTLAYREMLCVDIPWSETQDNLFAGTPTPPASAITADKNLDDLKAEGLSYHDRATEANAYCKTAFLAGDVTALAGELDGALSELRTAVRPGGMLHQQVATAEQALQGTSLEDACEKADAALHSAEDALREAERSLVDAVDKTSATLALSVAQEAHRTAAAASSAARVALDTAQRALTTAQDQVAHAEHEMQQLQNARNQLKERSKQMELLRPTLDTAMTPCTKANQSLQAATKRDDAVKHHGDTLEHAKKLLSAQRQMQDCTQYMDTARDLLRQASARTTQSTGG